MKEQKQGNWFVRHKVVTVIGAVIVVGLIASAANGNKGTSTTTNSTDTIQTQAVEKTEFKVGETATSDDKSITIKSVERNYDTGNSYAQPESGKEFVLVTVEIVNNGSSNMDYNTYEFKMQDSNGVQQSEALMALSEGKLNSGSLAPGGKVSGKLAYEVPKGDAGLKLLYQSFSLFSNKVITFSLQ